MNSLINERQNMFESNESLPSITRRVEQFVIKDENCEQSIDSIGFKSNHSRDCDLTFDNFREQRRNCIRCHAEDVTNNSQNSESTKTNDKTSKKKQFV
jgi:hypothetical protein